MYVERLEIENFRCFERAEIRLNCPNLDHGKNGADKPLHLPNVNLLLGDNGSGKSSLLKALVIGILGELLANSGMRPFLLIRNGENNASLKCYVQLSDYEKTLLNKVSKNLLDGFLVASSIVRSGSIENITTGKENIYRLYNTDSKVLFAIMSYQEAISDEGHQGFFSTGYSANRRSERPEAFDERLRGIRYQRVASLFEPHVGLIPPKLTYLQCSRRERWEEVVRLVNHLIPTDATVRLLSDPDADGEPQFQSGDAILPLEALSDGYRIFIGWVMDMLTHMARVTPKEMKLTDLPGIAIVDEVDLLLHPSWQRRVVEDLATTFPNLQWLISSHSPLVAGSLESGNIFITETDERGVATIRQSSEHIHGLSADQVLTSSYFGLASPNAPELERRLKELGTKADSGDYDAALEYMRVLRDGLEGDPSDNDAE